MPKKRGTTASVVNDLQVLQHASGRGGRGAHARLLVARLVSGTRLAMREETHSLAIEIMANVRYVLFEE